MFERFSEDARRAVVNAQTEAREAGHRVIGTEHLLLGLYAEPGGSGARSLREHGLAAPALREAVGRTSVLSAAPARRRARISAHIPFSRPAKKALRLSLRAARTADQRTIHSGHVLLGILATPGAGASRILADAGVDIGALRTTTRDLLEP
ncbi:Clp protease N-terminal domain-containing protein [Nocardiopsis sediminis]|uniref:Clp protease N-terminal domain-containing protein n=1 Tax=Nocardiopsis sediminis TaxID=1778267 RepID=A0ABV8FUU6_9ACTN